MIRLLSWKSAVRNRSMLAWILLILAAAAGCSTPRATDPRQIAKRRAERPAAFEALSPEERELVQQGQLRPGLTEDAVYIAWGKPAQILQAGGTGGNTTTWLYHRTTTDTYTGWRFREVIRPDGTSFIDQWPDVNYAFRDYVAAEILFKDGRLESWRTLAEPPSQSISGSRFNGYGGWPVYR